MQGEVTLLGMESEVGLGARLASLHRNRRVLSLVDQAVISATNMCTSIVIGRTCAKAELGLYASGLSLILLVTAVQSALIAVPYTISSPGIAPAEHAVYKGSTLLQQAALALVSMTLFALAGWFALGGRAPNLQPALRPVLLTLAAVAGLICFRDFARRVSYAELHFGFALVIDGMLAVAQLAAIGLLAWKHQLNASRALFSVGLASALAGALWLAVNWKTIHFSLSHATAGFRVNWRLGRWLFASSVLWSLSIDQYPWLLTTLRAPAEAAVWASCYGVMAFLNPVVLALNNDAAPRVANDFAAHGLAGLTRSVRRSALVAAVMTLPILLALVLFGARLVKLMYGAKFGSTGLGNSGLIVDLLAAGLWMYAIGLAFPYGMLTLQRPEIDFAINGACIASFLAVGLWLVRGHGVVGAACSFLLVQAVALGLRVLGFRRVVHQAGLPRMREVPA